MNFQMCQQSPGQWLMMKAIARRYVPKQGQFGLYAVGELEDQTGRKEQILFGSSDKSPLPSQSPLNIPCIWSVQWDANKGKFKAYFKGAGQEVVQPQAQAWEVPIAGGHPIPISPPARPAENKPDWDAISRGKVRHGVVCAYIQAGQEPAIAQVEGWVDYIMDGPDADMSGEQAPAPDGIPF